MSAATVRIFGLLVALAGACAPKPAPDAAPAAASVEAGAPTLEVGEVHRYALDTLPDSPSAEPNSSSPHICPEIGTPT